MPYAISRIERRHVRAVLADLRLAEALSCCRANALLVVVRRGAQHQHAIDVYLPRARQPSKRLKRSGIFHPADRIGPLTVSPVLYPIASPLVKQLPMPERRRRKVCAAQHKWRPLRSCTIKLLPALTDRCRVVQLGVLCQLKRPVNERRIQPVDISVVAEPSLPRLLIRRRFSERHIA